MLPIMESSGEALGLVETHGLVAGIEACDAMLKAARVRLLSVEQTIPALITVKITGETAAVQAACDAGAAAASRIGKVVSVHVIPRPDPAVLAMVMEEEVADKVGTAVSSDSKDLENMTVRELRDLARTQDDFPLRGREIARANREQLLDLLRA